MEQSNTKLAVKATLNVNASALMELRQFAKASAAAATAAVKASAILVRAAIHSGERFSDTVEAFYAEIRKDIGGLATAIGAERNKAGDSFVIPGSLMAQVSQVLRAVKFGVDLGTESEPKGLGEIRTATKTAVEASEAAATVAAVALLTGDDAIKVTLFKALDDAKASIKAADGTTLEAMRKATVSYCTAMIAILDQSKADKAATEATTAADAIATAATGAAMLPNGKAASRKTRKAA